MRILIAAVLLLGTTSLSPSFAQDTAKPPVETSQVGTSATPNQTPNQTPDQPRDQRAGRDPSRADNREMGQDWRMRRGDGERMDRDRREEGGRRFDGERMGRDDREMGAAPGMPRDRYPGGVTEGNAERGRYAGRGDGDHGYREKDDHGYYEEDRPRRRIKICVEYENGEEYCRYRR